MLTYRFQNMDDLWFYLLEANSIPSTAQVLKQKRLQYPNYQLDLRIIGSSHIISLNMASTQLTECLTCLPAKDIETKALVAFPFPLDGDEFTTKVGNLQHTIKFHTSRLKEDEYRKQHLLFLESSEKILRYEFPTLKNTAKFNPLTLLKYSCQDRIIEIWTYHTYPHELGIADTHTQIEIL